jgi:hypothetical protein
MSATIHAARARLLAALEIGEDTTVHRQAIARLEAEASRLAAEGAVQRAMAETARRASIDQKVASIVADVQRDVDSVISRLPKIPQLNSLEAV